MLLSRLETAHDVTAYPQLAAAQRTQAPHQRDFEMAIALERAGAAIGCRGAVRDARSLRAHKTGAPVAQVSFGAGGRYLVASGRNVGLHDARSGERTTLLGHEDPVLAAAVSGDGRLALSETGRGTVCLWEVASRDLAHTLTGAERATALALSPDGRHALTGHRDHSARLWDTASGRQLRSFVGHTRPVKAVAFDPGGRIAITGSEDRTARLWDTATGELVRALGGHAGTITAVAVSASGRYALTGSEDRTARCWETGGGRVVCALGHRDPVLAVAIGPDERLLVTAAGARIYLWDGPTGAAGPVLVGQGPFSTMALSADGTLVIGGGDGGIAELWMVDSDWAFLETVLPQAEDALAPGSATVPPLWPGIEKDRLEAGLDMWRDLLRCARRQDLDAAMRGRIDAVRELVLARLRPLVANAAGITEPGPRLLSQPHYRVQLVDPALARALLRPTAAEGHAIAAPISAAPAPPVAPLRTATAPAPSAARPERAEAWGARAPEDSPLPTSDVALTPATAGRGRPRPWRHLYLSVLGVGPGVALLMLAGPIGVGLGGLVLLGSLWQGRAFVRDLLRRA